MEVVDMISPCVVSGGVWTTQRDLATRGGIQGGALGPQVRPELNLPPSILPLPPPPLGANFTNPPPPHAQQANQAMSVCHATWGPGGARKGGREEGDGGSGRPRPHVDLPSL
ncbi:Receptor-like serine/threonine-protein kinase NCRK [Dissostichus eleginoides]|uniref:Receptor-like serine/threonine-protein kinase NCRK n=1 Tax=Dissostichus eleginoides TaxID=100907 RepID=A0AAD9C589_DISEL|nr:Receptor-like serine/threonine-protein kinase NCRK [Dissostichus eleginoides]